MSIPHSGLVIYQVIDAMEKIGPLKKATKEDSRSRAVVIPELTLKMLERWLDRAPECPQYPGLVFPPGKTSNQLLHTGSIQVWVRQAGNRP